MADTTAPLTARQAHALNALAQTSRDLLSAIGGVRNTLDEMKDLVSQGYMVRGFSNALGSSADDVNAYVARRKAQVEMVSLMEVHPQTLQAAASGKAPFFMEGQTFEIEGVMSQMATEREDLADVTFYDEAIDAHYTVISFEHTDKYGDLWNVETSHSGMIRMYAQAIKASAGRLA